MKERQERKSAYMMSVIYRLCRLGVYKLAFELILFVCLPERQESLRTLKWIKDSRGGVEEGKVAKGTKGAGK